MNDSSCVGNGTGSCPWQWKHAAQTDDNALLSCLLARRAPVLVPRSPCCSCALLPLVPLHLLWLSASCSALLPFVSYATPVPRTCALLSLPPLDGRKCGTFIWQLENTQQRVQPLQLHRRRLATDSSLEQGGEMRRHLPRRLNSWPVIWWLF